jgi:hypothetical protein
MSMAAFRRSTRLMLALGALEVTIAGVSGRPPEPAPRPGTALARGDPSPPVQQVTRRPHMPADPEGAPSEVQEFLNRVPRPEVRAFLGRVLARVPAQGEGVAGYQFSSWPREDKPTHEAIALKAIPGADPGKLIARIMDVDGYKGKIAHVEDCRSRRGPAPAPERPDRVRFFQVISVPGVVKIQQELELVDAGRIKGYRVAYWYLLEDETRALDRKDGARSAFSVGAWLVAPGVVGYALSSWPRRNDVNLVQWKALTAGADALAKQVVEGNIDGMAAWANEQGEFGPPRR